MNSEGHTCVNRGLANLNFRIDTLCMANGDTSLFNRVAGKA